MSASAVDGKPMVNAKSRRESFFMGNKGKIVWLCSSHVVMAISSGLRD